MGEVEVFATITPRTVRLSGFLEQSLKGTVRIIPQKKYPFKIREVKAQRGDSIRYRLEEVPEDTKGGYILTVENTKEGPGRYFDMIQLKTDSTIQPEINVRVYGRIMKPTAPKPSTPQPGQQPEKGPVNPPKQTN